MLKIALALVSVASWLVGLAETPTRSPEAEQLIFRATNEYRIKNGRPPLIWDQKLSDIAYGHSADMIVRTFFDHVSPDGEEPHHRIHRQHRRFIGNCGENLSTLVASPPLIPSEISEKTIESWANSPAHRLNLLDPTFTHMGIGVAVAGVEAKITQNFVQLRGVLKEDLPQVLAHDARLKLEVISYPEKSGKAKKYILAPVDATSEDPNPVTWDLSVRRPVVRPGSYVIQFCFPAPHSQFLEIFPGPQIEIQK